jgi:hypothetical protein
MLVLLILRARNMVFQEMPPWFSQPADTGQTRGVEVKSETEQRAREN